jgi:high-affinity iron transporter
MLATLIITLREGFEAALIIGIILSYLYKVGLAQETRKVWIGTVLATLMSVVGGFGVFIIMETTAEGLFQQLLEGFAMMIAVIVLTYMVFWMHGGGKGMAASISSKVQGAIGSGSVTALAFLAFVSVIREGIETVLFLIGTTKSSLPIEAFTGGILGLALAIIAGYIVFKSSKKVNIAAFFKWTSVLLLFMAAGMLSNAIGEFHEAEWLPPLVNRIWDTSGYLSEDDFLGGMMMALFGYNSSPSLLQVASYAVYLVSTIYLFFKKPNQSKNGGIQHAR